MENPLLAKIDLKKDEFYYRIYEPFFELWNIISVPVLLSERHNIAIQIAENLCRELHHFRERLGLEKEILNEDQELVRIVCNSSKHFAYLADRGVAKKRRLGDAALSHAYRYEVRGKSFRFIRIEIMAEQPEKPPCRLISSMVNTANGLIQKIFDHETFPRLTIPAGTQNRWTEAADIFGTTTHLPHPSLETIHRRLGGTGSTQIQCVRILPNAAEEFFDPEFVSFAIVQETTPVARHIFSEKY